MYPAIDKNFIRQKWRVLHHSKSLPVEQILFNATATQMEGDVKIGLRSEVAAKYNN